MVTFADEIDDGTQLPNRTISKLAAKRAKLPGPAGSDGRVIGQIRFDQAGRMYYRKNNQENWGMLTLALILLDGLCSSSTL